jgi:hypothetical protein
MPTMTILVLLLRGWNKGRQSPYNSALYATQTHFIAYSHHTTETTFRCKKLTL